MDAAKPSTDPDALHDPVVIPKEPQSTKRNLVTAALGVSAASALNIVLSFAFQVVLAALFGTNLEMDAYLAASTIPMIMTVILFGSLSVTFVPVFVEYQIHGNIDDAFSVVNGFLGISFISLSAFCTLLAIFAEPIIQLTNPGFVPGSSIFALTVDLFRLLLPSVVIGGLAGPLRSFYHARKRFILAAWAPVLNSLLMLIGTYLLVPYLGILAVAVGTLLGSLVQLVLLLPDLVRSKHLNFSWRAIMHPGVWRVLVLMAPWVISAIFSKTNTLIDRYLASQLEVGAISALGYANRLMLAITMVLTQGISVVLFPVMSEHAARRDWAQLRIVATNGVRLTMLVAIPFIVLFLVLGEPIVAILFERGQFDAAATQATYMALTGYLGAIFATCVGSVLTFVFYARQDTISVAGVAMIGFIVNVVAAIMLTPHLGVAGPAVAFSLSTLTNLFLLTMLLHLRLGGFELAKLGIVLLKSTGAVAVAALIWNIGYFIADTVPRNSGLFVVIVGAATLLGLTAFVLLGFVLGLEELRQFSARLVKRITRQ